MSRSAAVAGDQFIAHRPHRLDSHAAPRIGQPRADVRHVHVHRAGLPRKIKAPHQLKKLLAERDLEIDVMKEVAAKKW